MIEAPPPSACLPRSFYERPVLTIARDCIGKVLVHRTAEGAGGGRIVECEAYRGPEDLAAHSAGGRRTRRTEAMFGAPGHAYMFLLYGMHWAFNVVVAPEGHPHAVLIRAIEPLFGLDLMSARRGIPPSDVRLTNGPGKLCAALALDARAYGLDLCGPSHDGAASGPKPGPRHDGAAGGPKPRSPSGPELYLAPGEPGKIGRSPRINIDYAGSWAKRPWRFHERGNRYVSVPPRD